MKKLFQQDSYTAVTPEEEARRQALERLENPDAAWQDDRSREKRMIAPAQGQPEGMTETEEAGEHKGGCLFAILGAMLIFLIVFVSMRLDPPGRKTCLYCGDPISKGIYCSVHDVACQECGRITSERNRGYCQDCFKEKYGLD